LRTFRTSPYILRVLFFVFCEIKKQFPQIDVDSLNALQVFRQLCLMMLSPKCFDHRVTKFAFHCLLQRILVCERGCCDGQQHHLYEDSPGNPHFDPFFEAARRAPAVGLRTFVPLTAADQPAEMSGGAPALEAAGPALGAGGMSHRAQAAAD